MATSPYRTVCLFVLVSTVSISCDRTDSNGMDIRGSHVRTDSAGASVSITPEEEARTPLGWQVDTAPILVIGADDSLYLHDVRGVKGFPDGSLLVVDAGSRELRFFDSGGRLVTRAGGHGKGPGEFVYPALVPWPATDSLLLFDGRLPRY